MHFNWMICVVSCPVVSFHQDQALESSRLAREKEWSNFMSDVQDKCARIDDAYNQQEADLRRQFDQGRIQ
jgi:hypothetical protein